MSTSLRSIRPLWGFVALGALVAFAVVAIAFLGTTAGGNDDRAEESMSTAGGGSAARVEPASAPAPAPGLMTRDADLSSGEKGGMGAGMTSIPPTSAMQTNVLGRTVIRNGSVELTVDSVDQAFDNVRLLAERFGGYMADSSFRGSGEFQSASLTIRVPAESFSEVVNELRAMAVKVESITTSSQDVTEEYADLEATIRNLRAVEERYLTLLGEASNIGDILQVQDRLASVRMEIDRIQGRLNLLDNLASLATLQVQLLPEAAAVQAATETGFTARVADAWESSLETLEGLGTGIVVAIVWAWWLIPLAIVALVVAWRTLAPRLRRVDTPQTAA